MARMKCNGRTAWMLGIGFVTAGIVLGSRSVLGGIIFEDDFEAGNLQKWDEIVGSSKIVKDQPNSGSNCLQITKTLGQDSGGDLKKWFMPGYEEVYVRFYVKFAKDYSYAHHFVHLMGNHKTNKWSGFGKAGVKPNGTYFTTGIEPWFGWGKNPPPGEVNFYSYFLDMKPDPKMKDTFWGNSFFPPGPGPGAAASTNRYIPKLGEWECWEVMVKCNTPGKHEGEQALWINGKKIAHFREILWRNDLDVKVNCLWMLHYGFDSGDPTKSYWKQRQNHPMRDTVWFDDVVVATTYIGPKELQEKAPIAPN